MTKLGVRSLSEALRHAFAAQEDRPSDTSVAKP
jgi:hypothetical protein